MTMSRMVNSGHSSHISHTLGRRGLLAGVAAVVFGLWAVCRRRRPDALRRIGLYDEPTMGDVLGGAP